jgi:hypothetical protein
MGRRGRIMLIGSDDNLYKKLLKEEDDSENDGLEDDDLEDDEALMNTLIENIFSKILDELEYQLDLDYQSDMNNPLEEYYEPINDNSSISEYQKTIDYFKKNIPLLDMRSDEEIKSYLVSFLEDEELRKENPVTYFGNYKIGYMYPYISSDQEIYIDSNNYIETNSYYSVYERTKIKDLINKIDYDYVENNIDRYFDEYKRENPQSRFNMLEFKKDDILELIKDIQGGQDSFYFTVNLENFVSEKQLNTPDNVYIDEIDDFTKAFEEHLNSTGILGYRSKDNSVWEEEEEEE